MSAPAERTELVLAGPRFGPARGGRPKQLVVLLHGWGADGNDLIGLAPALAPVLPDAEFLAPDGPFDCDAGFGRQWFSLGDRSPQGDMAEPVMTARLAAVAPAIDSASQLYESFIFENSRIKCGCAIRKPNRNPASAYDFESDRETMILSHLATRSMQFVSAKSA